MVERAGIADIASLTELRLAYLQEDSDELKEDVIKKLKEDLPSYFEKNLNHNIFAISSGKWKKWFLAHFY